MTTDATLAALTAGLAEDERIARAAADADSAETGDGSWVAAEADYHGIGLFRSESEGSGIDYYPTVDTEHISLHDPARVLRQVEAIRMVVEVLTAGGCSWCDDDARKDFEPVLRALAGIYTEPTEEKS